MSSLLLSLQSTLAAAGFARSVVLGGPNPERQAFGVVIGKLSQVPADGYAVAPEAATALGVAERSWKTLPRIHDPVLKNQMGAISREAVALFLEARRAGWRSLALSVPETDFFGDLDLPICVRLIMGAADIFWRLYPDEGLDRIVVAVQSPRFSLSF